MCTTVDGVDVVGERIDLLVIAVVVLNGHFDSKDVADSLEINRFVMQHALVFVEVLNKLSNTAAIVKLVSLFRLFSLVLDGDADPFIEKRLLAQALGELVKDKLNRIEDLRIRVEGDLCAALAGLAGLLERSDRDAAGVLLFVGQTVAPDFQMQRL